MSRPCNSGFFLRYAEGRHARFENRCFVPSNALDVVSDSVDMVEAELGSSNRKWER